MGGTGPLGVLRLTEVRPEDRGFYTCTAHNIHGTSRESAAGLITIRGKGVCVWVLTCAVCCVCGWWLIMMCCLVGVYQYLMNVSDCSTDSLDDTIALVSHTSHISYSLPSYSCTDDHLSSGQSSHSHQQRHPLLCHCTVCIYTHSTLPLMHV